MVADIQYRMLKVALKEKKKVFKNNKRENKSRNNRRLV